MLDKYIKIWDKKFQQLVSFKKQNGHCNVIRTYNAIPQLGRWCDAQRKKYKKRELNEYRVNKLNSVGFAWNVYDSKWLIEYSELERFYHKNKHCDIPYNYPKNKKLGVWCHTQRMEYKRGKLRKRSLIHIY